MAQSIQARVIEQIKACGDIKVFSKAKTFKMITYVKNNTESIKSDYNDNGMSIAEIVDMIGDLN